MRQQPTYYLIHSSVLPEVFVKVVQVKALLETGKAKTVHEAVERIGVSRSAYYKYKEYVFPFFKMAKGKMITLFFVLEDIPGILSEILNVIARYKANILTINQNIPINGTANITISIRTGEMQGTGQLLIEQLQSISGIRKIEILASE